MPEHQTIHFPSELVLRLVDDQTGHPVSNIAITLRILARIKNNYDLGPPLSDAEGKIIMREDWVRAAILHTRNSAIMDYVSTLEDCLPDVEIMVMSPEDIDRAVRAMHLYGIEDGDLAIQQSIGQLLGAGNKDYRPQSITLLLDRPAEEYREVLIRLEKAG